MLFFIYYIIIGQKMKKDMNIYTIADSYFPNVGGMEMVAKNTAIALSKHANSVVFAPKMKNCKDDYLEVFRVKSLPIKDPVLMISLPKFDRKLKKYLKQNKPDIIHAHNFASLCKWFIKYGNKHNIPTVLTIHGYLNVDINNVVKNKLIRKIVFNYMLKTIKKAKYIWTVSQKCKEYYENLGIKNIEVMKNCTDELQANPDYINELKEKYKITKSDNVMCFINRIVFLKNIPLMLQALKIVKEKGLKFKFFIAGDGADLENTKNLVKEYNLDDCVVFLGLIKKRQNVASIYAIANLNLFPSVNDTSALCIGESASQKTPTLAMRDCSAREFINDNQNGFLCENTAEHYANRIIELFKDKQNLKAIGENAHKTIYKTWDQYAEEAIEKYKQYINKQ